MICPSKYSTRPSYQNLPWTAFHLNISILLSHKLSTLNLSVLQPLLTCSLTLTAPEQRPLLEVSSLSMLSPPSPPTLASSFAHASSLSCSFKYFHLSDAVTSLPDTDLLGPCSTTPAEHNLHSLHPIGHVWSLFKYGYLQAQGLLPGKPAGCLIKSLTGWHSLA